MSKKNFYFPFPYHYLCTLLLFVVISKGMAQDDISQLKNQLNTSKGKKRVEALLKLSEKYRVEKRDTDKSLEYASQAVREATGVRDEELLAKASIQAGMLHRNRGESDFAITLLIRGLNAAENAGNDSLRTDALHKIAVTYLLMRDFEQSYRYALQEEQMWRKLENQAGLASALNLKGISLIYLKRSKEAFVPLHQALEIVNSVLKDSDDLRYKVLYNIGDAYLKQKEYDRALAHVKESYELTEKIDDKYGIAANFLKLGEIYAAQGEIQTAIATTKQGLTLANMLRYAALQRNAYETLRDVYFQAGDYKRAFENQSLAIAMNDSLSNISRRNQITNMQLYYESERKERENKLLKEESFNAQLRFYLATAAALIALLVGIVFIARTRVKKKAIEKLRKQNNEIRDVYQQMSEQATIIENANIKIKESINYARRIQDAIQVNTTRIFYDFQDYFIIDRPRDIVSGDCYWFEQRQGEYYIALADCTGHGIPGAFMTILCNSLLNDIFNSYRGTRSPAEMLMELHRRLIHHLHSKETNINDGMDIAICRIIPEEKTLTYSGAKLPLLYIDEKGEFHRFRPHALPIGGNDIKIKRKYEDVTIYYQEKDVFYLTSDGFQDQFGGKGNKKFMTKHLYNTLVQIHKMPLAKQKEYLERELNAWQGSNPQTDDIMFIGIRLK